MNIVNLEQNTQEWLEWRKSGFSASEAPAVMGESKYFPKTPYQLYLVQTGQKEVVYTKSMEDGHKFEENGRAAVLIETGINYQPVCAENGQYIASFDGYNKDADIKVLEVKVTSECSDLWNNWEKIYKWQLVHQAIVAEVDKVYMCIYAKDSGKYKLEVFEVSDEDKDVLKAAWEKYGECVDNFQAPELLDKDYAENESEEWQKLSEAFEKLSNEKKEIESQLSDIKSRLIELADGQPTRGAGRTVYPVTRKGNVQYKKIPELKGVDLDQYRSKPSTYWSVR